MILSSPLIISATKTELSLALKLLPTEHSLVVGVGVNRQKLKEALSLNTYKEVLLFGAAGSLTRDLELGELVEVQCHIDASSSQEYQSQKLDLDLRTKAVTSLCLRKPLFNPQLKKEFIKKNPKAKIVEMESLEVSMICTQFKIPFKHLRFISDYADNPLSRSQFIALCEDFKYKYS